MAIPKRNLSVVIPSFKVVARSTYYCRFFDVLFSYTLHRFTCNLFTCVLCTYVDVVWLARLHAIFLWKWWCENSFSGIFATTRRNVLYQFVWIFWNRKIHATWICADNRSLNSNNYIVWNSKIGKLSTTINSYICL